MVVEMDVTSLHTGLRDPAIRSMTFLNEVAERHPDAISFAAGRPHEGGHDLGALHRYLEAYCDHLRRSGRSTAEVTRTLCQYGRTKGVIHDVLAAGLRVDEGIEVDPESIVVTVGAQEAMFLVLRALRSDDRDVLLAVAPTYVGLTGAALLVDLPVLPVHDGPAGVDLADLRRTVRQARAQGLRPRACYLVPDFANPSGVSVPVGTRRALLDLAAEERLLLLEDNPYGMFPLTDERRPTLKSLDTRGQVVYLGSLAKTCLPGARVGYAIADQTVRDPATGRAELFADHLARLKSMVTVNTSPIAQAVAAGRILAHGGGLYAATAADRAVYRRNLRAVVSGLADRLSAHADPAVRGIRWNTPAGGFFVVLTVPFAADEAALEHSACRHSVLWTPMRHFYSTPDAGTHALRLSCSALDEAQIAQGLDRLAAFLTEQVSRARPAPLGYGPSNSTYQRGWTDPGA